MVKELSELTVDKLFIRTMQPGEYAWARELNNAAAPHVDEHSETGFRRHAELAAWAPVAVLDRKPVGFALLFLAGSTYASENYRWVAARHSRFLYLDRIVVDPAHRGKGIGRALYRHAMHFGKGRAPILTCEVNEEPPNPESLEFHKKMGFRELGRQKTEGGKKSVVILGLDLE